MTIETEDRASDAKPKDAQEPSPPETALASAGQGICAELGTLPQGAVITEKALAALLGRTAKSIKRAVTRGELPPPVRILGEPRWTVGAILRHIDKRLEVAAHEVEIERRRFEVNSP